MGKYIKDTKGVDYRSLKLVQGQFYNSFVLTVSFNDVSKITDPSFWPDGIWVRKYYPAKN